MTEKIYFLDNTRISGFKDCPMKYHTRHELGWTLDKSRAALDFGGSWHEMLKVVYENCAGGTPRDELYQAGCKAFMAAWLDRGMPEISDMASMDELFPRVPGVAYEMLDNFLDQKWDWLQTIKVLSVEKPFIVPLLDEPKVYLVGRRDAVIENEDGIWALEHKTSSLYSISYGFQYKFMTSFSPNPQIDGYTYATHLEYGEKARGVYVNAALMHKKHHDIFKTIPIYRSMDMLETWYNDTVYWVKQLLRHEKEGWWPHNTSSCSNQYGSCEFRDICETTADPDKLQAIPGGYKVEFWEPFDEASLKEILINAKA